MLLLIELVTCCLHVFVFLFVEVIEVWLMFVLLPVPWSLVRW